MYSEDSRGLGMDSFVTLFCFVSVDTKHKIVDILYPSSQQRACLKGYVQDAGGPNHWPLCRLFYALGSGACLYQTAEMKCPLFSLSSQAYSSFHEDSIDFFPPSSLECQPTSGLSPPIASGNLTETLGTDVCILIRVNFWLDYYLLIYPPC